MALSLLVADDIRCDLGPVDLNLSSSAGNGGRSLSTAANGFLIPAATGDEGCSMVNDMLGLPSTATSLSMTYTSANRPGPVAVRYATSGGLLSVGDSVTLALPAGSGELTGDRNPLTGDLTAELKLEPFTTEFPVGDAGSVPVSIAIASDSVTGRVPPGPGLTALLAGFALLGYAVWNAPRFITMRQKVRGARWHGLRPSDSVLTVGLPTVVAVVVAASGLILGISPLV